MAEQEELIQRYAQIPYLLAQKFTKEYDELMTESPLEMKIEITKHLEQLMIVFRDEPDTCFKSIKAAEQAFLEKHGSLLKAYHDVQFYKYFNTDIVLSEKEIFTSEEWNSLPANIQALSPELAKKFQMVCINLLSMSLQFLYLDKQIEPIGSSEKATNAEKTGGITKARQLLAIYFLLKSQGIEHRADTSVSAVARLIHLISNTPLTNIQNSDIYKKYREMPYYKKGKELLADLEFIKPFFEAVNLKDVLNLVNAEIEKIKKD